MTEETLPHAFEPFFSDERGGHRLGLGLSMVRGFAARWGAVRLES